MSANDNSPDCPIRTDEFERAEEAAQSVLAKLGARSRPRIAVVLGSGLGDFAEALPDALAIPYAEIPHFPRPTAIGHAGRLIVGDFAGVPLAVMQGRVHQYEGYSAQQAAFPARVLARMGVRALVLTNAAGGINTRYSQGALVLIADHINLQGANPLSGPNDERFGPRFPDMSEAYSVAYRRAAMAAARERGIELHEGIYAAVAGPNYETPAEIRYLRAIGADLVGMSTVPEVLVARHMGLGVLAISCVTNMAAGLVPGIISHQEVLETGRRVRDTLMKLLAGVLPRVNSLLSTATSKLAADPGEVGGTR